MTTFESPMPESQAMLHSPARSALREAAAALDLAERCGYPLEISLALAQMGRCYRALQAPGAAESCLERALAWARTLGAVDQAVEILCLLAETGCAMAEAHEPAGPPRGRMPRGAARRYSGEREDARHGHAALERTRDWAFEATGLAVRVADPQWEIKVLLRISDVLDRCGDHEDATQLQARAMRLMYRPHLGGES